MQIHSHESHMSRLAWQAPALTAATTQLRGEGPGQGAGESEPSLLPRGAWSGCFPICHLYAEFEPRGPVVSY